MLHEEQPEQCWKCHNDRKENEEGDTITVDLDVGDPEVGPDPNICDVWICDECFLKDVVQKLRKLIDSGMYWEDAWLRMTKENSLTEEQDSKLEKLFKKITGERICSYQVE